MRRDDRLEAMYHALVAIDAKLDAVLALMGQPLPPAAAPSDAEGEGGCEHPQDKRVDTTTMGNPDSWLCTACGTSSDDLR